MTNKQKGLALLVVALVATTASLGYVVHRLRVAHQESERRLEAAQLEVAGLTTAHRATVRELEDEADSLREIISETRLAAPDAEVREVTRWRTRDVEIPCPSGGDEGTGGSVPPPHRAGSNPARPVPSPSISLGFEVRSAELETRAGNRIFVAELDVIRTAPPPEEVIATLRPEVDATSYFSADVGVEREPRWFIGVGAAWIDGDPGPALHIRGPAWAPRLLGWRPRVYPWGTFGASSGLDGFAAVGLGVRVGR